MRWGAVATVLGLCLAACAGRATAEQTGPAATTSSVPATRAAPPDEDQIRQAVRLLSHPSLTQRRAVARRLAAWGRLSFGELQKAAAGPDLEGALAARELLAELDSAVLVGGQVTLGVDRPRIAWDEPLTLTVRVNNPTAAPIRVPWPTPRPPSSRPASDDAEQVGALLDVADFLTVTGPDGQDVELRFEPLDGDPAVYAAVTTRAGRNPPSFLLAPGGEVTLQVRQFNRGWARYPLLAAGRYRIAFAYQPEWKDASWTAEGLGRVQAGPVTLDVVQAAPESIRHASRPLELTLLRRGEYIEATVVSTWDRAIWLYLGFGPDPERYAKLQWRFIVPPETLESHRRDAGATRVSGGTVKSAGTDEAQVWEPEPEARAAPVGERIKRLASGAAFPLARIALAEVYPRARRATATSPSRCEVAFRYMSVVSAARIRDELQVKAPATEVPTSVFTGALLSEPLVVDSPSTMP